LQYYATEKISICCKPLKINKVDTKEIAEFGIQPEAHKTFLNRHEALLPKSIVS
jgi:hypothetical protein